MSKLTRIDRRCSRRACALALSGGMAAAQKPLGFATLPAGTLNYTTASAIAKVLKEKGGMNVLVQPTAGDAVILPMVNRNEAEIGITNILEVVDAVSGAAKIGKQPNLRLIGVPHTFRGTFWVKKDSPMKTIADLKGHRDAGRLSRHADHRPAGAARSSPPAA